MPKRKDWDEMAHILIAEDEQPINELLRRNLALVGHTCRQAYDGNTALVLAESEPFDLVLLDVMLPGLDGFAVKKQLPEKTPVIFVTAKTALSQRLEGLGLGADDYVTKPFEVLELLARVEAVLRRTHAVEPPVEIGGCHIDLAGRQVLLDGPEVALTPQEFALLATLVRNRNLALSREKLLALAWGYDYGGDTRTVDVHVQKLRRKLKLDKQIQTVYKLGYRLSTGQ